MVKVKTINHGSKGKQRMHARLLEERQLKLNFDEALDKHEPLTEHLMEKICDLRNFNRACSNKRASRLDGMTVNKFGSYIRIRGLRNHDSLVFRAGVNF